MNQNSAETPLIKVENIVKEFSSVRALNNIGFDLYPGEIHCLVGENGAGKSTLMKILSGAYKPTAGNIFVLGKQYTSLNPTLSKELGISIVYQENDLVSSMNVIENIYVGNELTKGIFFTNYKKMKENTIRQITDLEIDIDIERKIENMSVADQQFVKILKAIFIRPSILIMDEPTSMFNVKDAAKVLNLTRKISSRGIGVRYISHFFEEVVSIADRITVVRDGSVINTYDNKNKNTDISLITKYMVGRPVHMFYTKEKNKIGETYLEVKKLQLKKNSPSISFSLRRGEILGFAGMVGSGRSEIVQALSGAAPKYNGDIIINGKKKNIRNPRDSIDAGIAFITEDRQKLGLMLQHSVLENTLITAYHKKIKSFFISLRKQIPSVEPLIKALKIKTPSIWTNAVYLSGGNQQKVVLAKWLSIDKEIYIFDEPTRGIDINAKTEFYKLMCSLTQQGKSIIMISSDMPELISMSDRVLVIRNGTIEDELTGNKINEHEIIKKALGVVKNEI